MAKQQSSDLIGQREQRIHKVNTLLSMGINPYPSKGERSVTNDEVKERFDQLEGSEVKVVGRITTWRKHGEIQFINLQDDTGTIQLYLKISELENTNVDTQQLGPEHFDLIDLGDHIEAQGIVTRTQNGEESVLLKGGIKLLSKAIRPLPSKFHGLQDKEARYRRRYLDMTLDPAIRERFKRRAIFWDSVRDFLNQHGFHEINTPVLEHTTGGADAKPFVTHYDVLAEHFYLRISHELPLKRLLGGGFEKVYDIGPRFRNEGFSDEHLPEHIAMEWYWAYADYKDGMEFTKELFRYVLQKVYGTLQFNVRGFEIDLAQEWEVIDFAQIIKERFDVDIWEDSLEKMAEVLAAQSDELSTEDLALNRSRLADGLWKQIRKSIAGPAFLTGVPKFLSPLSKTNTEDPRKTDRFHPIIAGSELANAFGELNDPQDQLERFVEQQKLREGGDQEAHMLDIDFVEMLEYGMPPAVGFGMSERVFWIFEDVTAREGVPFPPMKRGYENTTKKIYEDILQYDEGYKTGKSGSATTQKQLDPNTKLVAILNKELEGWKITNTMGHIGAFLGAHSGRGLFGRDTFQLKDKEIPANIQYPFVALGGSDAQLHNMIEKLEKSGMEYLVFTQTMVDQLTDNEVQKVLADKTIADEVIYGIGIVGNGSQIDSLTKKFSLWK